MPRNAKNVSSALGRKGFERRESKDAYFHLCVDGKKTKLVWAAALVLLLALWVSGCSRSDRASTPAPETPAVTSERPAAAGDARRGRENPHARIIAEDRARQLARAIYADIALYEGDKVAGHPPERVGDILWSEFKEGGELFRDRVSEELHRVFDEERTYFLRAVSHRLDIDSADSARFFARALLESARRESNPADASSAIDEARQFYRSRVPADLYATFDEVMTELDREPK